MFQTVLGKFPDYRGFTLIEILVALVIFATGLLSVAGLTVMIVRGNAFSSRVTTATFCAQDKLEELQDIAFRELQGGDDQDCEPNDEPNRIYTRVWKVDEMSGAGTKAIEVRVCWRSRAAHPEQEDSDPCPDQVVRGSGQHQVVLRTIRSKS